MFSRIQETLPLGTTVKFCSFGQNSANWQLKCSVSRNSACPNFYSLIFRSSSSYAQPHVILLSSSPLPPLLFQPPPLSSSHDSGIFSKLLLSLPPPASRKRSGGGTSPSPSAWFVVFDPGGGKSQRWRKMSRLLVWLLVGLALVHAQAPLAAGEGINWTYVHYIHMV